MDGIIVINKEQGSSSFDVIRALRKILKTKKIGHTGTLDPLAEGVLVVCVGKATKLASSIEAEDKDYVVGLDFGYETDTYDTEGRVVLESDIEPKKEEVVSALEKYIGEIAQLPPMYSAIKINGEKLYNLARKGIEVEREARKVTAYDLKLLNFSEKSAELFCKVSKGFYIRSLVHDLGRDLGTYATMTALKRTRVGKNFLENSYTVEQIQSLIENQDYSFIKTVEEYFDFEKVEVLSDDEVKFFRNGNEFPLKNSASLSEGKKRVYYKNEFLGLAELKIAKNRITLKSYKYTV